MKEKNKIKINNNKYPLPKIKYTNSSNQTLKRHKQNGNQQQLNINNLYNLDQYDIIQSREQKQKEEYLYNSKTNVRINNHRFNSGKLSESKSNTPQNNLKYLLREFGLSEYNRKLNELGYDNNNYLQIGYLSRKSFNNLMSRIHIFPGHISKMEKFYEYLRKINISSNYDYSHYMNNNYNHNNYNNSNTNSNTNSISSQVKVRRANYNAIYSSNSSRQVPSASNNYNHYYNYDNYNINKQQPVNNQKHKKYSSPKSRPKTTQTKGLSKPKSRIRNNYSGNKLMKRNMENNYQLNSAFSNNTNENNKNNLNKEYLTNNNRYLPNNKLNYDNDYYLELKNRYLQMNYNNLNMNESQNNLYDSNNNYYADKQKELEDNINRNIEKMLNYYMVQLNDKLDKSYETVEDSSLSYVITSQINESQNISDKSSGSKILPNYKLPSMNNFDSLNNKKNVGSNNNKNNDKLRSKFNDKNKNSTKKEEENKLKSENNNKNAKRALKEERKDDNAHEKEKEIQKNSVNTPEDKKENKELIIKLKDEEKKEIENENQMHKDIIKIKDEYVKEIIKKHSDQETSTKSKDSKEHEIEEDELISKDKKQTQPQNQAEAQDIPIDIKLEPQENEKEEDKKPITKNHRSLLLNDSNIISDRYSLEQNIFDSLRLNRSLDEENINKDTLKFDIEFMCRCLGMALMRIIEQGKEKQHITELYTSNESDNQVLNFKFYNSDFNKSINLLKDFFNANNNEKLGEMNMISILEKFCIEHGDIDNNDIDMMKHIIKNGDEKIIQKDDLQEETFKLKNGLADIENEIKFIGEFFSYGKKKKNYQNLSENTKKILCKDLSYIKEIDSELNKTGSNMNSKINNNNSGINNSNINNVENYSEEFNMSKTSKEDKEEDSKSNQENKNKILEDDKNDDEDYNYEDEFLNDENDILDEKKEKENNIKSDDIKDEDKKEKEKEKEKDENEDEEKIKIKEIKDEIKNEKIKEELNKKVNEKDKDKDEENIIKKEEISTNTDLNDANGTSKENIEIDKNISDIKNDDSINESNNIETNYIIDADNMEKYKDYLLKQFEIFDDDFIYYSMHIPQKRYMPPPDPQSIFEFVANIMILTKMEKEVIIISLIYIERLIFNTGFIINSRNWRKIIFIALIIASKLWDDDSLENIHFSQVFTHLKIGEINLLERTFLELINYKVFIKFGEYMKYYLAIKNLALRFNFNGEQIVPVSVQKMMKIQEYAYQMQKRMRKKVSLNNSAQF